MQWFKENGNKSKLRKTDLKFLGKIMRKDDFENLKLKGKRAKERSEQAT